MRMARPLAGHPLITQPFGPTEFTGEPRFNFWPHFHQGTDYAVPIGTPVLACAEGRVQIGHDDEWGYGMHVLVNHGNGLRTLYGHLSAIHVPDGAWVMQGQTLGVSGNTGNSSGPHLHCGVLTDYDYPLPLQSFMF